MGELLQAVPGGREEEEEELEGGVRVVVEGCWVSWEVASEASDRRVTPIEVSGCNIVGGCCGSCSVLDGWVISGESYRFKASQELQTGEAKERKGQ